MKILFFLLLSSTASAFHPSQALCPQDVQNEIRGYENDVTALVNRWIPLLEGSSNPQASNAIKVLECSKKVLEKGLVYYCGQLDFGMAKTHPLFGNRVYLDIRRFAGTSIDIRQGIILHEATHKCGTNDATYFDLDNPPKNIGLFGWSSIAGTYEYWVRRRFCLPPDCN